MIFPATRLRVTAHVALAGLLTALLGGLIGSLGPMPSALAQPAVNDRLGICHVNLMALDATDEMLNERYRRAVEAGAGWTRYEIRWDQIESSGGFDFSRQDDIVRRDVANGLKIDAIFNATPASYATSGFAWVPGPQVGQHAFTTGQLAGLAAAASAPANLFAPIFADGTDTPAPNKSINPNNYWARFVRKTVERYMPGGILARNEGWPEGAGIRVWEVWNEPDRPFWTGTVAEYYRLLKVAYLVVESTDPAATIMLAGLAHWPDPNWPPSVDWFPHFLDTVASDPQPAMRDTYNQYFDAAAWHWYSNPRHLYDKTVEMRSLMASHGINGKPIWVNESGVPILGEEPGPMDPNSPFRGTIEEQAAWVIQAFAEGFAADVKRIFFFQLYDDCGNGPDSKDAFGLIRNPVGSKPDIGVCAAHPTQPGVPRPAYTAYQVAATEFQDVQSFWRSHDFAGGLARVALFRPPHERVLVLWNWSFSDKTFNVIATGSEGEVIDMAGTRRAVVPEGGSYSLTLPAATNDNWDQAGAMIGGKPYILVETDTLAPTATINPLPASSSPTFQVSWDLQDWGTGIAAYEIWYSDGEPASAEDWQLLTENTSVSPVRGRVQGSAEFTGQADHAYYFAARAQDRAGNWSSLGEPQAWTTVGAAEAGVITGRVFDIREQPVASATVQVVLDAGVVSSATTDVDGQFVVGDVPLGETYGVTASADGYGSWPARWEVEPTETATESLGVDLDLPPLYNAVNNGGFEAEGLAGWVLGGNTPPMRSTYLKRTGDGSALLGFRTDGTAPGDSTLNQVVDVPEETPALGFWYRVYRQPNGAGGVEPNRFEVLLLRSGNGGPRELYTDHLSASEDWQYQPVDLSAFAGEEVKLIFNLSQPSADLQTVVYIDNVALGASTPQEVVLRDVFLPLLLRSRP